MQFTARSRRWRPVRALLLLTACAAIGVRAVPAQGQPPSDPALQQAQRLIGEQKFDSAAVMLRELVQQQPANAQAWLALGAAHRGLGQVDEASAALQHAFAIPRAKPRAALSLFLLHAHARRPDSAFRWFTAIRESGGTDLTSIAGNREVAALHDDKRFALLFPDRIVFDPPFVEKARIIHEWRGEAAGDEFGWIARGIGDADGDGITDVVISATQNPPNGGSVGRVYVYSGKSGKLLWKREGERGALLGIGLESAGDVNADGIEDVVAGAPGINSVLVMSGRDGRELLRLRGDSIDAGLGSAVAGVGDIDGDGHADVVAGAPSSSANGSGAGRVYVFSGKDGRRLHTLDGTQAGERFGSTVGGGRGTFIIGASGSGTRSTGRVFVYRGLSNKPAFVKDADSTGAALGAMFVSVVGDVDGDGVADIYATDFVNQARGPATGRVYVYSGRTGETVRTLTGEGAGEGFGIGAARTGDVDGDGHDDLVIGSWQYGGAAWSGGRVRVMSGADGRVLQSFTGRVPGETLGFDAVGVGDIDGDGMTDYLLTSAWSMVNGVRSGRTYIVAGNVPRRSR